MWRADCWEWKWATSCWVLRYYIICFRLSILSPKIQNLSCSEIQSFGSISMAFKGFSIKNTFHWRFSDQRCSTANIYVDFFLKSEWLVFSSIFNMELLPVLNPGIVYSACFVNGLYQPLQKSGPLWFTKASQCKTWVNTGADAGPWLRRAVLVVNRLWKHRPLSKTTFQDVVTAD